MLSKYCPRGLIVLSYNSSTHGIARIACMSAVREDVPPMHAMWTHFPRELGMHFLYYSRMYGWTCVLRCEADLTLHCACQHASLCLRFVSTFYSGGTVVSKGSILSVCSVFERLEERMENEGIFSEKSKLKKLARRLRSVHEELTEYNDLLQRCHFPSSAFLACGTNLGVAFHAMMLSCTYIFSSNTLSSVLLDFCCLTALWKWMLTCMWICAAFPQWEHTSGRVL